MAGGLAQVATDLISRLGYTGLTVGLVVDSFGLPIPSEILITLGTVLTLHGRFNPWAIFVIGTLAQVVGGACGYMIGRYGGEPILERYGKYVLITQRDLARTHRVFEKHGRWYTMVGRCVPGIRGLIAYPAGVAEMRVGEFLLYTAIGSAVWTAILMGIGYLIGDNMAVIDQFAAQFSLLGIVIIVAVIGWFAYHHWPRKGA